MMNNEQYNTNVGGFGFGTASVPQPQQQAPFSMGMQNGMNQGYVGYGNGGYAGYGIPQNNGITGNAGFNKKKASTISADDFNLLRAKSGETIEFSAEDVLKYRYNFINPNTGELTVRIDGNHITDTVTGDEWDMVDCNPQYVTEICKVLNDIVKTIQLTNAGIENSEALDQLLLGAGLVCNNLPGVYERNKNAITNTMNNICNMVQGTGYNGYNGYNYYNGVGYANPSYVVSLNGSQAAPTGMPNPNGYGNGFYQQQMMGANPMGNMGMGGPVQQVQPMGGTMMGQNPFMQQATANTGTTFGNPIGQNNVAPAANNGNNVAGQMNFGPIGQPAAQQPQQQNTTPMIQATPTPGNPAIGAKAETAPAKATV